MGRIEDHYKEEIGGRDRGARNENASNTALGGVAVQPPPWSGLMSPMLAVKMPGGLRSWGRKSGAPGRLWWKKELSMLCASSYGESVRGIRVPPIWLKSQEYPAPIKSRHCHGGLAVVHSL